MSIIVIAKAALIGVVYWRRAEILGRSGSCVSASAIIAIGIAIAAAVYISAQHFSQET